MKFDNFTVTKFSRNIQSYFILWIFNYLYGNKLIEYLKWCNQELKLQMLNQIQWSS